MTTNPNKLSHLWRELKRRKVIQVIVVYATAAFMILEAVEMVFTRLNFPDWTISFVMILLAIGFPLAIIFSWIFDYTPTGIMKTKTMEEIREISEKKEEKEANQQYSVLWNKIFPWSLTVLVTATIVLLWIFRWNKEPAKAQVLAWEQKLSENVVFRSDVPGAALAFSPDGKYIVYSAFVHDTSFLYKRSLDQLSDERIPGTQGGYSPFFSPDEKWIGFFTNGKMKKVSSSGGAPQFICDTHPGFAASWDENDVIIYSDYFKRSLWQVSADGGAPVQITKAMKWANEEIEDRHSWPSFLPGGKEILYTVRHNADNMRIVLLSLETGETKTLIEPGTHATYLNTGHLVYAWKGDLLATPFDLNRLKVTGDPVIILRNVMMNPYLGLAHFTVSDQGALAYVPGNYKSPIDSLFLMEPEGRRQVLNVPPGVYQNPVFSPEGRDLILTRLQEKASIWIFGLERSTFRRFTDKDFESFWAIWTPDSKKIVYNSNRHGGNTLSLFIKGLDGETTIQQITQSKFNQQPKTWSLDGTSLIYMENILNDTGFDIYMTNISEDEASISLFNSQFQECHPNMSPDGKWMAYVTDEPGQDEVYVCSFPDLNNRTQISNAGGTEPVWDPDGKKLYYRDHSGRKMMVVAIETVPKLTVGDPVILFEDNFKRGYPFGRNYDISPDGRWFLMIKDGAHHEANQMNVIYNWSTELLSVFK